MIYVTVVQIKKPNDAAWPDIDKRGTMADNKQGQHLSDTDILITETVLKVAALEKLLVRKGIITSIELTAEMKKFSEEIVETMRKTYLNKKD